jgi:hypothetical protein
MVAADSSRVSSYFVEDLLSANVVQMTGTNTLDGMKRISKEKSVR